MHVKEPSFVTIDGRKLAYDEVSPSNPKGLTNVAKLQEVLYVELCRVRAREQALRRFMQARI
jgi:hypothetical protein